MNASDNGTRILGEQAHLLDLVHDAIILRDMQGVIIFWSHGAEKLFGWTSDEALGKHADALLHTHFPQPLEAIEAEALRAGHWEGELIHTRRDGTPVVATSRWAVWKQDHGAPLAILERAGGKADQLIGLLQQKYGYTREQAEAEFNRRLKEAKGH